LLPEVVPETELAPLLAVTVTTSVVREFAARPTETEMPPLFDELTYAPPEPPPLARATEVG
jgi:hypothetical protein